MRKFKTLAAMICFAIVLLLSGSALWAEPIDVSDAVIQQFLGSPFQFDYTTIRDDVSLRKFIDALDYHLAVIEYRQRREFTAGPDSKDIRERYKRDLEAKYRDLMRDGFIYKILKDWKGLTSDPVNKSFIHLYTTRRNEIMADPSTLRHARELSERIANRLYNFHFEVEKNMYSADEAARIIFGGGDIELSRLLHTLVNDSAAILSKDAANLYNIYKSMGQQRGYRTSQDYMLSRLSFDKESWLKIADNLKAATDSEYKRCLDQLKKQTASDKLNLFEIERLIIDSAGLPDSCFSRQEIDGAVSRLLDNLGFDRLSEDLAVRVDSSSYPALAIRLYPPDDNILLTNNRGGFVNYTRLVRELGRALPWVYADTALPYLLRDYPIGTEEMLTDVLERAALNPEFLKENFSIAPEDMERFTKYRRWSKVAETRRVLLYFYFDYHLSNDNADDPAKLYMELENSLFDTGDKSYQWIETLLTGGLDSFPEKLAHIFSRVKTIEILHNLYGNDYESSPDAGQFLINEFCMPGRSRSIEDYVSAHTSDQLSVDDLKRQDRLK